MELLGDFAFGRCTSLKHVDVPKTSNYIGVGVFEGCTGIESVIYLNTKFPERIFGNCTSLSKVLVGTQPIIDVFNNAFIQQDPKQKIAMYVEVYDDLENYNKLCGVQFCNKNIEVHCVQ